MQTIILLFRFGLMISSGRPMWPTRCDLNPGMDN